MEIAKIAVFFGVLRARFVPARHLHADEDADNDDQEINRDGGPFRLAELSDDAAEDHGASASKRAASFSSSTCTV